MGKRILITGGAGFIGSHLSDELLDNGYQVRVLDNFSEQVHGPNASRPAYLNTEVEVVKGDVRNAEVVTRSLAGVDAVFHFAAMVGVGQSMYQLSNYTEVNNLGTAVLLEALIKRPVERLVVASSMSVYGEGLYLGPDGSPYRCAERSLDQLKSGQWELRNSLKQLLTPVPTPESKAPAISSMYALSKYDQERMCLMIGQAYSIPSVALRFFNVYGTRQSLSNPYTGVLAIFASRYLNRKPPIIYEDGYQQRDFVHVQDVARACCLVLQTDDAAGQVFNIGSGQRYSIREISERMASVVGVKHIEPVIEGKYRVGDIRHCFADISMAKHHLGYEPLVSLNEGLTEFAQWLEGQVAVDCVSQANTELAVRGLTL